MVAHGFADKRRTSTRIAAAVAVLDDRALRLGDP